MDESKDGTLVRQVTRMRERTEQLCKSALSTSPDGSIHVRLQLIHTLFCAMEARLRDGMPLDGDGRTSALTKEDIEHIAAAVARKLDRSAHIYHAPQPAPKQRPS